MKKALLALAAIASLLCGAPAYAQQLVSAGSPLVPGVVVSVNTSATDATTATNNSSLIQTALNRGGNVFVTGQGSACLGVRLLVNSNTTLTVEPGLTLKACSNIASRLIGNYASTQIGSMATVTTTWTSGLTANVSWTGHGLVLGDWAWLYNASGADAPAGQTAFIGVFPVVAVVDANTITVRLRKIPTANSAFTLKAFKADQHITVRGAFDYNYPTNQGAAVDTQLAVFAGVNDLVADEICSNARKYCLTMEAVSNYKLGLTSLVTNSDGAKIYGPAFDGEILHIDGNNLDDLISFQPKEAAAFNTYPLTEGDIIGIRGGNISHSSEGTGTANTLVFYAHSIYTLDEIDIKGVGGDNEGGASLVSIRNSGDQNVTSFIGKISIAGITGRATWPVLVDSAGGLLTVDNLTLETINTKFNGNTTNNSTYSHILVKVGAAINNLVVRPYMVDSTYGASASSYFMLLNGNVLHTVVENPYIIASTATAKLFYIGTSSVRTTDEVEINGGYVTASSIVGSLTGNSGFTNTPEITLRGVRTNASSVVDVRSALNVNLINTYVNNANLGIIRFNGVFSVNLRSIGAKLLGTSVWITAPSAGTVFPYSPEITADVTSAYIGRVNGGVMNNTNAAAGTLTAAGIIDSDGTGSLSWKRRTNSSLTY